MKVTKEKTENSQAYLTVEAEPSELEDALKRAYQQLVKKTNVPGFRKGKAPREILERHVGKEAIMEHAINDWIPEAYEQAVKDQNLDPIAQPEIELSQLDPVIFKAVVPLSPTVTLGDYHSIKMVPEEVKVDEENVDKVIEQLQHQHATWEPAERPVAYGDLVTIDVKSTIEDKPFVDRDGLQYQVEIGTNFPVPGFVEQIVGMNLNDEKEFTCQLPEDYSKAEYAGKEVSFKVKLNEIKQEKLPEVNEDFVKTVSSDCQDLAALRTRIFDDLKMREEENVKNTFEEKLIQAAIDMSKLEYPPIIVEQESTRLLNQQLQYMQYSGINAEDYLKSLNKSVDELKEELKPRATKRVSQSLILEKVAEEEKLEVSEEEIQTQIESLLQTYTEAQRDEMKQQFESETALNSIKNAVLIRKSLEKLVEIAKGPAAETPEPETLTTETQPTENETTEN